MANLIQQDIPFAAGALVPTPTTVRVRSNALWHAVEPEIQMAVLAEGTQWEIHAGSNVWHLDVPPECQDLSPADKMLVVDKIMRRIAEGACKAAPRGPAIRSNPIRRLIGSAA